MAIPLELLKATEGRGVRICGYGGPTMKKTLIAHTLVPPTLHYDIGEGGTACLLPWIRRRRNSTDTKWTIFSQEERQMYFDLVQADEKEDYKPLNPAPYIDTIHYDVLRFESLNEFCQDVQNFDFANYNSVVFDSLQELSECTKTYSRGPQGLWTPMSEVNWSWARAQERAAIILRFIRDICKHGVMVYFTASEDISKDYIKNPLSKQQGEAPQEPFSVKGTVNLPGQLAAAMPHFPDVLCHAKKLNGKVTWVTDPEVVVPGSGAYWDAKDRYGRLMKYEEPNFYKMFGRLYGVEGRKAIYDYALTMVNKEKQNV